MCGACRVSALDGDIERHDTSLSREEHTPGNCMTACVSHAASERLVLDL